MAWRQRVTGRDRWGKESHTGKEGTEMVRHRPGERQRDRWNDKEREAGRDGDGERETGRERGGGKWGGGRLGRLS